MKTVFCHVYSRRHASSFGGGVATGLWSLESRDILVEALLSADDRCARHTACQSNNDRQPEASSCWKALTDRERSIRARPWL